MDVSELPALDHPLLRHTFKAVSITYKDVLYVSLGLRVASVLAFERSSLVAALFIPRSPVAQLHG